MFLMGQFRRHRWKWLLAICTCALVFAIGARGQQSSHVSRNKTPDKLSFNQSIPPILSENCYPCHGPDPGARKAKLRLDRAEFAYAPHDKSGPAIIPGQTGKESTSTEDRGKKSERPHASTGSAQDAQARANCVAARVGKTRRGVRRALVLHCSEVATASRGEANKGWVRTPIDNFILARLEKEGLSRHRKQTNDR